MNETILEILSLTSIALICGIVIVIKFIIEPPKKFLERMDNIMEVGGLFERSYM